MRIRGYVDEIDPDSVIITKKAEVIIRTEDGEEYHGMEFNECDRYFKDGSVIYVPRDNEYLFTMWPLPCTARDILLTLKEAKDPASCDLKEYDFEEWNEIRKYIPVYRRLYVEIEGDARIQSVVVDVGNALFAAVTSIDRTDFYLRYGNFAQKMFTKYGIRIFYLCPLLFLGTLTLLGKLKISKEEFDNAINEWFAKRREELRELYGLQKLPPIDITGEDVVRIILKLALKHIHEVKKR